MRRRRHRAQRGWPGGFTLVELLVVVAILSLLVSILAPSLSRGMEAGRSAKCRGNLHQMGVGMLNYIAAQERYYPCGHTWKLRPPVITWTTQIRMYAGGEMGMFHCPIGAPEAKWEFKSDPGQPAIWGYKKDERRLYWNDPFSYGYNNWGTKDFADPQLGLGSMTDYVRESGDPDWGPLPAHRVKRPASMMAIGDSRTDLSWDAFIDSNQPLEYPFDRHLDQANILFADAHAESMYTVDIIDFDNTEPQRRRRWNNDGRPH